MQTGKYCQVVQVDSRQQIICNLTTTDGASVMEFTGSGFSYQGQGFNNPGSTGGPLEIDPDGPPANLQPGATEGMVVHDAVLA